MDAIVDLLNERFIARHDAKAWQTANGYARDLRPLTTADIEMHLRGESHRVPMVGDDGRPYAITAQSLGHYIVDPASQTCKVLAFDIDLTSKAATDGGTWNPRAAFADPSDTRRTTLLTILKFNASAIAHRVAKVTEGGAHVACSFSGSKGLHVYAFLDGAEAADARRLARVVLEQLRFEQTSENFWTNPPLDLFNVEVYPKQDRVEPGSYGNLMRLPLGVNGKSGKRGAFIRLDDDPTKMVAMKPADALGGTLPWA